jgi:excinuclease ABC subunit C
VGKALSLRKRVASYFRLPGATVSASPLSPRITTLMTKVADLEIRPTTSEAEALLLEAQLIKEHQPSYNVAFRDDKTYPMLKVTNEPFPRLLVTRRKLNDGAIYFGPYTDAGLMHEAVRFMRRVFPLRTCKRFPSTPCLEYHLGQCLAPCAAYISARGYQRIVDDLVAFLQGRRDQLLRELSRRMATAARDRRYEEAARLRNQLQALTSVIVAKEQSLAAGPLEQLQAALKLPQLPQRIEAFDLSNIFGQWAVGSMVVFVGGKPHKAHYRRFKIQTVQDSDDCGMMREVIRRRYSGTLARELPLPDLILVDGGKGQLSAACEELATLVLQLPTIGLAKRFERLFVPQSPQPIVLLPTSPVLHLMQHIRDEAHRFAIAYHRRLRGTSVTASALDRIRGIGPSRKQALLRHFGSFAALTAAAPADVARAGRLSLKLAEIILQQLQQHQEGHRI